MTPRDWFQFGAFVVATANGSLFADRVGGPDLVGLWLCLVVLISVAVFYAADAARWVRR